MLLQLRNSALCLVAAMVVATSAVAIGSTASAAAPKSGAPEAAIAGTKDPAPPPHIDPWIPSLCATAEFTSAYSDPPRDLVAIGTITRCQQYIPDSKFAVAVYRPGQVPVVYTSQLQRYQADQLTLRLDFFVGNEPVSDGVGVCALSTRHHRVGCARLSHGPDGAIVLEPIPVDHPLVQIAVTVIYDGTQDLPDPGCAHCV
ncbi:hypothetical protein [Micromonospora sp. NBC_01813]|uniref:hypothetical protein n=1 Tax=Micromonospora sp. NBC_01813 TaxID=2975988 RepID=UPI002DD9C2CA|nr:hypothetical protein [Micromonospora sp. NBC_01813]WSA10671.1 hypothetical protein OG958_07795 [Micromonospora sp. NBC_01813]